MKDAFNVNDFLGILEQGVKINKRREDKEASVKSVSSKVTAPSLEDLFEETEPLEVVGASMPVVEESQSSEGFKIIDVDDYDEDAESHLNTNFDEQRKKSQTEISKISASDELSKKVENVKIGADVPFSYDERACSKEENSQISADIEISKITEEKSILKNPNSISDIKNSISPTLEPIFEMNIDDINSEENSNCELSDNSVSDEDSNISYFSEKVVQPVVNPADFVEAITESAVESVILYTSENESWNDEHTDFTFEEPVVMASSEVDEDDFDVEYDGESELEEMDEESLVSSVVEDDIYDVDDFDDEEDDDYEEEVFDDEDDDDEEYSGESEYSDDIYDVDDDEFDDEFDDIEEDEDYEEPAPEYDFSGGKSVSEVFSDKEFEGVSSNIEDSEIESSLDSSEDDCFDEMETDFDLEEDSELEDSSIESPVVSKVPVSPEDEMDVESPHRVKEKVAPVYKTFDDDDDDEFTRRAFERAMGSRVQAKINEDVSKKEELVISDNFEEVEPDETNVGVVVVAEEQAVQAVKEEEKKPSVSSELSSKSSVGNSSTQSKSLGVRDISEPKEEIEEPVVKFVKGMSLKDFLRENPTIRQEEEVLKYFSKSDIVQAERRSQIMIRRGKIIL